jgi:hypothetical protein
MGALDVVMNPRGMASRWVDAWVKAASSTRPEAPHHSLVLRACAIYLCAHFRFLTLRPLRFL